MSGLSGRRWASAYAIERVGLSLTAVVLSACALAVPPTLAADVTDRVPSALRATPSVASIRAVRGTIKDSVGQVLDGVEILIVRRSGRSASNAVAPVATASSDVWGRFAISDLAPGVYGVAALKQGYRTYIGSLDTRVDRILDVVLLPMPPAGHLTPGTVPENDDWLLRLPRRTVFRETAETPVDELDADAESASSIPSADVPIQLRVDQLFAVRTPLPEDREDPVKLQGNETRVRVAAPIGERGSVRLDGRRASLGSSQSTSQDVADGAEASSDSIELDAEFTYDVGLDSRLRVTAYFNDREREWGGSEIASATSSRRSWGAYSDWQKQLGDASSMRVGVGYESASMALPGSLVTGGSTSSDGIVGSAAHVVARRTATADAAYATLIGNRHHFKTSFKARLFDTPSLQDALPGGPMPLEQGMGNLTGGQDGWSLQLSAQDSWAMTGPFALVYGLGYQQALTDRDAAVVVPQLGGAWASDGAALRFVMTYHAIAEWESSAPEIKPGRLYSELAVVDRAQHARAALPSSREIGYAAELEVPLTESLILKGASSFVPLQLEGLGGVMGVVDVSGDPVGASVPRRQDDETYLTNGTTAVGESTLSLTQELGDARIWFEVSRGQAQGMLARGDVGAVLPALALGEWTYNNGAWGFQMIPSGTDLRVLYKRIVESQSNESAGHPPTERETLELRLIQNLMRFEGLGNWRLLMAVRMAKQDSENDKAWSHGADPAVLRAFNEGVSAGLSVTF